jgi:hypothetical protein
MNSAAAEDRPLECSARRGNIGTVLLFCDGTELRLHIKGIALQSVMLAA